MSLGGDERRSVSLDFSLRRLQTLRRTPVVSKRVPTGSIVRTEVGSVLVQNDVCNGCGYCVVSCPFGVIDRRPHHCPMPAAHSNAPFVTTGKRADSCRPARRFARPNRSSSAGSTIFARAAAERVQDACKRAVTTTRNSTIRGKPRSRGIHAFFLFFGEPEAYGLPPKPQVPTIYLKSAWTAAVATAIGVDCDARGLRFFLDA